MSIKTILVQGGSDRRAGLRLEVGLSVASKFDAHLISLYTVPTPLLSFGYADYFPAELIEQEMHRNRERVAEAKKGAELAAKRAGREIEWRSSEGPEVSNLIEQGHYCDLVIVGQRDPSEEGLPGTMVTAAHVALGVGRPILCVPYAGQFSSIGKRVMIAWKGTREAARAVHDALPLLERAEEVIVFSINPDGTDKVAGAELARNLSRHGIKAEVKHTVAGDMRVGDTLLSAIADVGADLLVMGAYGHSRARELVFGGATRSILESMTVPVLLSH